MRRIEAQCPGRDVSTAEYRHICHRYWTSARLSDARSTLEVACGPGLGIRCLLGVAARYVGADLSAEHLVAARAAAPAETPLIRMDAQHLPFGSGCWQTVLALEVAQYVDAMKLLREMRRVMTVDGVGLVTAPNPSRTGFRPSDKSVSYLDAGEWREACRAADLHVHVLGAFTEPPRWRSWARYGYVALVRAAALAARAIDPHKRLAGLRGGAKRALAYKPLTLPRTLPDADLRVASSEGIRCLPETSLQTRRYTFLYVLAGRDQAVVDGWLTRLTGAQT